MLAFTPAHSAPAAQWFRRDELPAIPPRISIARKQIDAWLTD